MNTIIKGEKRENSTPTGNIQDKTTDIQRVNLENSEMQWNACCVLRVLYHLF